MHRRLAAAAAVLSLTTPLVALVPAGASAQPADGAVDMTVESGFEVRRHDAVLVPLAAVPDAVEHAHHEHEHETAAVHAAEAAQPLGATVPLAGGPSQVVLEFDAPGPVELAVRSRSNGTWSGWVVVGTEADDSPDGLPGEEGSVPTGPAIGPIWLGAAAEELDVVVVDGAPAALEVVGLTSVAPSPQVAALAAAPDAGAPPIIPRSTWSPAPWSTAAGCEDGPRTASRLNAAVLHHTVSVNDYTEAQVAELIRGIQYFHINGRGWCDIAYNAVVDRFGRIWEGRAGGLDKAIIGGHATGFNTGTFGVVALGQFHPGASPAAAAPSMAMLEAIARVVQWKLALHGTQAGGNVQLVSGANGNKFALGATATVHVLATHRDLAQTSCAGDLLVAQLGTIRARVAQLAHAHHLFRTFVGRSPTDGERVTWAGEIGRLGRNGAALALARSEAWAGAMVDRLYSEVLGRSGEVAGRNYWLGRMVAGLRFEDVAVQFYGSAEYYAASGSASGFVTRLYDALLHRAPDAPGLAYWVAELESGRATPARVVGGFYASIESRLDRVAALYQSVLGRGPDGPGQQYWAQQLLTLDDVRLAADLAGSDEFAGRALAG